MQRLGLTGAIFGSALAVMAFDTAIACSPAPAQRPDQILFNRSSYVIIGRITDLREDTTPDRNRVLAGKARAAVLTSLGGQSGRFPNEGVWFPYRYESTGLCPIGQIPKLGEDYVFFFEGSGSTLKLIQFKLASSLASPPPPSPPRRGRHDD